MIATFVPFSSRLKYLPRIPLLKSMSDRSASGSSLGDFFILVSLFRSGDACAYEADGGVDFSVNDEKDAAFR